MSVCIDRHVQSNRLIYGISTSSSSSYSSFSSGPSFFAPRIPVAVPKVASVKATRVAKGSKAAPSIKAGVKRVFKLIEIPSFDNDSDDEADYVQRKKLRGRQRLWQLRRVSSI